MSTFFTQRAGRNPSSSPTQLTTRYTQSVSGRQNRLCFVGDYASGKTCLRFCFEGKPFVQAFRATIGVDSTSHMFPSRHVSVDWRGRPGTELVVNDVLVRMDDTSGEERFVHSLTPCFVRHAQVVLLCFDLTRFNTFTDVKRVWIDMVKNEACSKAKMFLVGLKADLTCERAVPLRKIMRLANEEKIEYFEVSSKSKEGVQDLALRIGDFFKDYKDLCNSISLSSSCTVKEPHDTETRRTKCCR